MAETQGSAAGTGTESGSLLDRIMREGKLARDESQVSRAKDVVGEFVNQVLDKSMTLNQDTVAMINHRIAQIDELLSAQINEIMHDPKFQQLEAAWRGLNYLVMNTETGVMLKLRIMYATKKE